MNSARSDPGPWYGNDRERVRFEGAARLVIDGLRVTTGGGRAYHLTLDVPHYDERRHVTITFKQQNPRVPTITVDGPTASPHRFGDGSLCIWDPRGPTSERWRFDDGLLHLIGLIAQHLFKEYWWRETQEWLGPEAPHGEPKPPLQDAAARPDER